MSQFAFTDADGNSVEAGEERFGGETYLTLSIREPADGSVNFVRLPVVKVSNLWSVLTEFVGARIAEASERSTPEDYVAG